jgi:hypothetical protein
LLRALVLSLSVRSHPGSKFGLDEIGLGDDGTVPARARRRGCPRGGIGSGPCPDELDGSGLCGKLPVNECRRPEDAWLARLPGDDRIDSGESFVPVQLLNRELPDGVDRLGSVVVVAVALDLVFGVRCDEPTLARPGRRKWNG